MKKKRILIIGILLTIIALFSLGAGFLRWKNRQKRSAMQSQGQEQMNQRNQDNLIWYEIRELGLKFRTTKDIARNLEYTYREGYDKELKTNYKTVFFQCGALSEYSKTDINLEHPLLKGRPYKELGTYYIVYWAPQVPCTYSTTGIDIVEVLSILKGMD